MDPATITAALGTAYGYVQTGGTVLSYLKWIYDMNNTIQMKYEKNGNTIVFTAEETYIRDIFVPGNQPKYVVDIDMTSRLNKFKIIEIIGNGEKSKEFLKDISNRFSARGLIPQHEVVKFLTHMAEEYYNEHYSTATTCLEKRTVKTGDWDMAQLPGGSPTVEMMILKLRFTMN